MKIEKHIELSDVLCGGDSSPEPESICTVRLTTTAWRCGRGAHLKKSLTFMKRKCQGYNILDEDCSMVGAEEVIPNIVNLHDVPDGVYEVRICNESRDWETNVIDDYDYELVAT